MKKFFAIVFFCAACVMLHAQDAVHFEFSDGIENAALKSKMEQQISALLTAINRAETNHSSINYEGINIDDSASRGISEMWDAVHFRIVDDDIVEHCHRVKNSSGVVVSYQVWNIAVEIKPLDNTYNGSRNQEVSINLDLKGVITDFNFIEELNQYLKTIRERRKLKDNRLNGFAQNDRTAFGLKGNVKKVTQRDNSDTEVNWVGCGWDTYNLEFSETGKLVKVNGRKGGLKYENNETEYFVQDYEEFKETTKGAPDGVFVYTDTPEFGLDRDAKNRISKRISINSVGEDWEKLKNDDQGRVVLVNCSFLSDGDGNEYNVGNLKYTYDENGNVIKIVRYAADENKTYTITYKYEQFDQSGNWLVRVMNCEAMGFKNEVEKRTVEYW